jgi:hypothetical protein
MPEDVRRLRAPWPTLVGTVRHLDWRLEREFRFGHRVVAGESGFLIGGSMKGGSSSIWRPATPEENEAYQGWQAIEAVRPHSTPAAFEALCAFLEERGIKLRHHDRAFRPPLPAAFRPEVGSAYEMLLGILRELPEGHLRRPQLRFFQIGGFGPDAAKASAYEDGTVVLYEFAVRGARRVLAGLTLHELGHAHERALDGEAREALRRAHRILAPRGAFFALDYLLESESRRHYQQLSFEEFAAETYLVYTAAGASFRSWIAGLDLAERDGWVRAYAVFRETFKGVEYE